MADEKEKKKNEELKLVQKEKARQLKLVQQKEKEKIKENKKAAKSRKRKAIKSLNLTPEQILILKEMKAI